MKKSPKYSPDVVERTACPPQRQPVVPPFFRCRPPATTRARSCFRPRASNTPSCGSAVSVQRRHLDAIDGQSAAGVHRCGSSSSMRLSSCVGKDVQQLLSHLATYLGQVSRCCRSSRGRQPASVQDGFAGRLRATVKTDGWSLTFKMPSLDAYRAAAYAAGQSHRGVATASLAACLIASGGDIENGPQGRVRRTLTADRIQRRPSRTGRARRSSP